MAGAVICNSPCRWFIDWLPVPSTGTKSWRSQVFQVLHHCTVSELFCPAPDVEVPIRSQPALAHVRWRGWWRNHLCGDRPCRWWTLGHLAEGLSHFRFFTPFLPNSPIRYTRMTCLSTIHCEVFMCKSADLRRDSVCGHVRLTHRVQKTAWCGCQGNKPKMANFCWLYSKSACGTIG